MAKIVPHGMDISPPTRTCLLTLKALNLPFEYKATNLLKGEHLTEEFLKKNPQHTVPVLEDTDGTCIWDSHAICCYLIDKYAASDEMYPKDLAKRAAINQRLFFDASVLYMALGNVSKAFFLYKITEVPKAKVNDVLQAYDMVETFLGDHLYITGDVLTIADFSCGAMVTSLPAVVDIDPVKYPKITAWIERLAKLPYYLEANVVGAQKYINLLKSSLTHAKN